MRDDKHNFEKVLAKMGLLEKEAESEISSEFLDNVPDKGVKECLFCLSTESREHFDMLSNCVENLEAAMEKYRGECRKIRDLYKDKIGFEGREDLRAFLQSQLTVEIYAKSQYESLLDMLESFDDDEVVEDGKVSFVAGELRETVEKIKEDEKKHVREVEKVLDELEPYLSTQS